MEPQLVGEEIISVRGPLVTARRYYAGTYPHLGRLHFGLTGPETVVEGTFLRPTRVYEVFEQAVPEGEIHYLSPEVSLSAAV